LISLRISVCPQARYIFLPSSFNIARTMTCTRSEKHRCRNRKQFSRYNHRYGLPPRTMLTLGLFLFSALQSRQSRFPVPCVCIYSASHRKYLYLTPCSKHHPFRVLPLDSISFTKRSHSSADRLSERPKK
jgi:hypothetical protein